jgi:hypothetical protein
MCWLAGPLQFVHDAPEGATDMQAYLYSGSKCAEATQRLAIYMASLGQPTLLARFGAPLDNDPLDHIAQRSPLQVAYFRLPGFGLPQCTAHATELAVQTALTMLRQLVAGGNYSLVILEGIREPLAQGVLDATDLCQLARCAHTTTQIAMT